MQIIDNKNNKINLKLKDIISVAYFCESKKYKCPTILVTTKDQVIEICYADYFKEIYEYCLKNKILFKMC